MVEKQAYTAADAAKMMSLSARTVIRLFEQESGVLILERRGMMHKRRYRTIRIPRAVYERVIRRLANRMNLRVAVGSDGLRSHPLSTAETRAPAADGST